MPVLFTTLKTKKTDCSRYTKMKNLFIALLTVGLLAGFTFLDDDKPAEALTFKPDFAHSHVGFKVRHLGISNVHGKFDDYDFTVSVDPEDLSTLSAEVTIQSTSINTGNDRRDDHLRSDDFFNAEMYPTITFKSTGVRNIDGEDFELVGDLTIRDVTKEIVIEGEMLGTASTRDGKVKIGFEAESEINRIDFNLKWNNLTETGGLVVAHDIDLVLELEMVQE